MLKTKWSKKEKNVFVCVCFKQPQSNFSSKTFIQIYLNKTINLNKIHFLFVLFSETTNLKFFNTSSPLKRFGCLFGDGSKQNTSKLHLSDAFIQSDLQCIQAIHFCISMCSLGIEPTTFCAANAML